MQATLLIHILIQLNLICFVKNLNPLLENEDQSAKLCREQFRKEERTLTLVWALVSGIILGLYFTTYFFTIQESVYLLVIARYVLEAAILLWALVVLMIFWSNSTGSCVRRGYGWGHKIEKATLN